MMFLGDPSLFLAAFDDALTEPYASFSFSNVLTGSRRYSSIGAP
jgi:hypothetical protein